MTGIVVFNVVMVVLGVVVGTGVVSTNRLSDILGWLHSIIGITPPAPKQARVYSLIWVASMIVIVDGLLFMLVFLTMRLIR